MAQSQQVVTTPARSPAAQATTDCPVHDRTRYFVGRSSSICVPVTADDWTTLSLPDGVRVAFPADSPFEQDFEPKTHQLHVTGKPDTLEGATASIKVIGPGYTATVKIVASTETQPEIVVEHITELEAMRHQEEARRREEAAAKIEELDGRIAGLQSTITTLRGEHAETAKALATAKAALATVTNELTGTQAQLAATLKRSVELEGKITELERALVDLTRKRTETERKLASTERRLAETSKAADENEREMLIDAAKRYTTNNQRVLTPTVSRWVRVKHGDQRLRFGKAYPVGDRIVFPLDIENPVGRPLQLTGVRTIDAAGNVTPAVVLDPTGLENAAKGIITTVPEGEEGQLFLAVQRGQDEGAVRIELTEYKSLRPPIAAQFPDYVYVPVDPWTKQIILGPSATAGYCWLAESPGSPNEESMACYSLGVRLTKGFTEALAFEADVLGGWTASGEMRSAKFGRAVLGGRLRFGVETVPYVRLGIGGQLASVDGSNEVGAFWTAGAGVDRRLGENVVLGIGLSWEESTSDGRAFRRSVGIGIQLGVGWNP